MKEYFSKLSSGNGKAKRIIGVILILVGLTALVTPFTPGSWLVFVGLELLGIRFLLWEKIKSRFLK
ncbi:MAG: PGPGW domain-containing protein [bacterium]|nr:PGPGW domain-containing protein [bacterium]